MLNRFRRRLFLPFIAPAALLYSAVFIWPMIQTVITALTNQTNRPTHRFVGLTNFANVLDDPHFWMALKNSVSYMVVGGLLNFLPGLFLAWCLSQPIRFKRFYRMIVFAPVVISVLVTSLLWKFLLNPNWGLLNGFLRLVGLESWAIPWLGDTRTALLMVTLAAVWQGIGMKVVLLSAGLERIPRELYEAARVDGATDWQQFSLISLPLLWEVFRTLVVLWTIQSMQMFAFVFVMTGGGPLRATEVAATYTYEIAFTSQKFGYATALATVLMLAIVAVNWIVGRLTRRATYEF